MAVQPLKLLFLLKLLQYLRQCLSYQSYHEIHKELDQITLKQFNLNLNLTAKTMKRTISNAKQTKTLILE